MNWVNSLPHYISPLIPCIMYKQRKHKQWTNIAPCFWAGNETLIGNCVAKISTRCTITWDYNKTIQIASSIKNGKWQQWQDTIFCLSNDNDKANFNLWNQINISSYVWIFPKKRDYYSIVETLRLKMIHVYTCSPFLVEITLSCLSNKSLSYISN